MGLARRIESGSIFTLFLIWSCWQFSEAKDYFNVIEKLHATLLQDYNKQIRPVEIHTQAVNLETAFHLTNINFDEKSAHFSAQGYFSMKWIDPRFVWEPVDYDGLKTINLPSDMVWTPDLEVYNSPGRLNNDRSFAVTQPVVILSDGSVLFVPLSNLISICHPDLTNWPYDTQVCTAKIGSWTYDARKITISLKNNSTTVETEDYDATKSEWNLFQTSAEVESKMYPCCPDEPYEELTFKFSIQRRSPTARFTVLIPTIGIVVLTLITFFIPPTASAKLTIGAVNLILLCSYLIHFDSILPPSETVPRIVLFHGETVLLVILSMLVSVVTMNLTQKSQPPPTFIQMFLSSSFGRFLGAWDLKQNDKSNTEIDEKDLLNNRLTKENDLAAQSKGLSHYWIALSVVLHRLMFFIYCIIFVMMMNCYVFI